MAQSVELYTDFSTLREERELNSYSALDRFNATNRFPFVFSMPVQFYTQAEALDYLRILASHTEGLDGKTEEGAVDNALKQYYRTSRARVDASLRDALTTAPTPNPRSIEDTEKDANLENLGIDPIYARPNQSTTEVGGNDAINCYWQFGWDDDIVPPMLSANKFQVEPSTGGLGRVYSEMYDTNQQLLHISVGIPKYTNLVRFYSNLFSKELAKINTGGDGFCYQLGKIMGSGLAIGIELLALPFRYVMTLINYISNERITKYVDFEESMFLYYRYVNTALIELAVDMGLMPKIGSKEILTTEGNVANISYQDQLNSMFPVMTEQEALNSKMYPIFKGGFDLFRILSLRDTRERLGHHNAEAVGPNTNDIVSNIQEPDEEGRFQFLDTTYDWFADRFRGFMSRAQASWQGADKYLSFKIEKSADASESFSNSTGESPVTTLFNSNSSIARTAKEYLGGKSLVEAIPGIGTIVSSLGDFVSGFVNTASGGTLSNVTGPFAVIGGEASVDIPEIWQSSSFSKSHNFNVTLRSPYGDPYSIFTNIYIPLVMLMCMAMPRATGYNSYMQPFVLRAYSKGMFSIPYGIIESMSIRRGASEFGWNKQRLPTVVEISFTIKDLSPFMVMGMDVGADLLSPLKAIRQLFAENSNFQEYLLTLSGMGLAERLIVTNHIKRRLTTVFRQIKSSISVNYGGFAFADSKIGRIIGAFSPYTRFPD